MDIADRIKKLRKDKGMLQRELAEKVGVSRVAIVNYERGERMPNADILSKIAEALGTSVNYLTGFFYKDLFAEYIMMIKGNRTIEEYAHECGLESSYVSDIIEQKLVVSPDPKIIKKLSSSIPEHCDIDYLDLMTVTGNLDSDVAKNIKREKNNNIPFYSTSFSFGGYDADHENDIEITAEKDNELLIKVKFHDEVFTQGDIDSIIDFIHSLHYKKKMKFKYSSILDKNSTEE